MTKQALGEALNEALSELVQTNDKLVVLNADVAKSVGVRQFSKDFPDRFLQMGISEQDMFLAAGGMASCGFIPVVTTFAKFGSLRVAEQISTFIAYPKQNVKIVVSHGGISPAGDGVTHQSVEDLGAIRAIPNMTVIEPYDGASCKELIRQAIELEGPVYFRMNRDKLPLLPAQTLKLGQGVELKSGTDMAILAMGGMVAQSLAAARRLEEEKGLSVAVYGIHTLKPLDEELVLQLARRYGALVTAEEHNIQCGLGEAVSRVVTGAHPVYVGKVAIQDTFAQSGAYAELMRYYHISEEDVAACVLDTIRKRDRK